MNDSTAPTTPPLPSGERLPVPVRPPGAPHQVVIVGGGAGGLELATRLGDTLGQRGRVAVTLVDRARTHVWKPKLHEIAAGSMNMDAHELDYLAQAHWHHFEYRTGQMVGLDRTRREVLLAPLVDDEGQRVIDARRVPYDTLVMAVGSLTNDFGTPGVAEHAIKLETAADARRFNQRLINAALRAHSRADHDTDGDGVSDTPRHLRVAIIGAGATGVELAAELHHTLRELVSYGLQRIQVDRDLRIDLIEAADRILPGLPPRLSTAAEELLRNLGVQVHTSARVAAVEPQSVVLADGRRIDADLIVWAAGVQAPAFLAELDGLETNRIHQLVVNATLQTTRDNHVFALGDCAACPWLGTDKLVPPRAQAAHQQASFMLGQLRRRLAGEPLREFRYRDFGSLVSLGDYSTVGSLMGALVGGNMVFEGLFAKLMYKSLYKQHELALHGWPKVALDTIARAITRRTEPHVKLH
ncbi:NAD(P)/FAD-dependent oxidoreductase [Ottowia sp. GY511]|uniref:NAD(P)/FAD-dependent oxidoreductase n=1 Tax=Ottowia flava TaxID=2675430 RepID=A0ABW4KXT2_9BURK|nr:NAD(P)/FAD-dependent oxidoreductase [Ottowia sp. GY511]TXK22488.1 NAD(P)/FAD-dependent oxidoreductase [Ottowia sp. GY511]